MLEAGHPPLVPTTDTDGNDREEIAAYVESLKRRTRESNRVGGSSTQDKSLISRRSELWMLPVPVPFSYMFVLMIGKLSFFYRQEWRKLLRRAYWRYPRKYMKTAV